MLKKEKSPPRMAVRAVGSTARVLFSGRAGTTLLAAKRCRAGNQ